MRGGTIVQHDLRYEFAVRQTAASVDRATRDHRNRGTFERTRICQKRNPLFGGVLHRKVGTGSEIELLYRSSEPCTLLCRRKRFAPVSYRLQPLGVGRSVCWPIPPHPTLFRPRHDPISLPSHPRRDGTYNAT